MRTRNVGTFDKDDSVGTGMVGAACGDVMKLQIKVNDDESEDANLKHMAVAPPLLLAHF